MDPLKQRNSVKTHDTFFSSLSLSSSSSSSHVVQSHSFHHLFHRRLFLRSQEKAHSHIPFELLTPSMDNFHIKWSKEEVETLCMTVLKTISRRYRELYGITKNLVYLDNSLERVERIFSSSTTFLFNNKMNKPQASKNREKKTFDIRISGFLLIELNTSDSLHLLISYHEIFSILFFTLFTCNFFSMLFNRNL